MSLRIMTDVWELDLSQRLKFVLLAFADHANDDGYCYPSIGRIAWKCGYSKRQVIRIKTELVNLGLLEDNISRPRPGKSNFYRVKPHMGKSLTPYGFDARGCQNVTSDNMSQGGCHSYVTGGVTQLRHGRGDTAMSPKPSSNRQYNQEGFTDAEQKRIRLLNNSASQLGIDLFSGEESIDEFDKRIANASLAALQAKQAEASA